ncbi:MAG: sulfate ABC transporter permease subunit CysT, partial [Patescibacteria group bacterium]|nr:sulfate ABC transporter permease subunit CysT [Patescibacteria group bacterium]
MPQFRLKQPSVLPGFGLSMGFTLLYMTLMLLIPLGGLVLFTATRMTATEFWEKAVVDPRVVASYKLSFGAALIAATLNGVFGLVVAWVL